MKKSIAEMTVDGTSINPAAVSRLSLIESIDSLMPTLKFTYNDMTGSEFAALKFRVGSLITVKFNEVMDVAGETIVNKSGNTYETCKFVITRVYNGNEYDDGIGFLEVFASHPWDIHAEVKGKAYSAQKVSEVIKDVCKNATKQSLIKVEDKRFESSSDAGDSPRYRTAEKDYDFIRDKLLPYCSIGDSCAWFWVGLDSYANLRSFKSMYQSQVKALLAPRTSERPIDQTTIKNLIEKYKIDNVFHFNAANFSYGHEEPEIIMASIKKRQLILNEATSYCQAVCGIKKMSMVSGKDTDSMSKTSVPILDSVLSKMDVTGIMPISNVSAADAVGLMVQSDRDLLNMLTVNITFTNVMESLGAGDVIELYTTSLGDISKNSKSGVPWVNGKWLIKERIISSGDTAYEHYTTCVLVRPTLVFDREKTAIDNPDFLASI